MGLASDSCIAFGNGVLIFPWTGTKKLRTLTLALQAREFKAGHFGHAVELQDCRPDAVYEVLAAMAAAPPPDGMALAMRLAQPSLAKFDGFLSRELMGLVTVSERLKVGALPLLAQKLQSPLSVDLNSSVRDRA